MFLLKKLIFYLRFSILDYHYSRKKLSTKTPLLL